MISFIRRRPMVAEFLPQSNRDPLPGFTWDYIKRLKDATTMKVLLKGIVAREDQVRVEVAVPGVSERGDLDAVPLLERAQERRQVPFGEARIQRERAFLLRRRHDLLDAVRAVVSVVTRAAGRRFTGSDR